MAPSGAAAPAGARAEAAPEVGARARAQDVGGVLHLEHVNLEVPDLEAARLFFSEGLGLTADPDTTAPERGGLGVMWYNAGRQQLHICKGPEAHRLPPGAAIGLVVPSVDQLAARLEGVQSLLGEVSVSRIGHAALEVRDPWGNAWVAREPDCASAGEAAADAGPTPWPAHASLGIESVQLPCHPGCAEGIAKFYREVLGARAELSEGTGGGGGGGLAAARVVVGPGSKLVFKEAASAGPRSDEAVRAAHTGWHVAIYVSDFSGAFRRCEELGLLTNDHPFRDKCYGIDDALRNRQFRIKDVALERGGPLLFRLDHEIRSLHHPRFTRPLRNRLLEQQPA